MQKTFFINYADENYFAQQQALNKLAAKSGAFDSIIAYSNSYIQNLPIYFQHQEIFDARPIGDDGRVKPSFFLFKPTIIHETLKAINHGDILMYIDCGDALQNTDKLREFLLKKTKSIDIILTKGAFKATHYTKRDAFFYMKAESQKYYDSIQIEAGIFVCKKSAFSMLVVSEWLKACCDRRIISDDENMCGLPNFPSFKAHRWDQAALNLIAVRRECYQSDEMRQFVTCNKND